MSTTYKPTLEQIDICNAFQEMMESFDRTNRKVVINAGAGTGKTSTLVLLADIAKKLGKKGRFMAFNKAIVTAASKKMPDNVKCSTFHAYFYGTVGQFYKHRSDRVSADFTARHLGIKDDLELSDKKLTPVMQARILYRAINKFSMSDDMEISRFHIPFVKGVTNEDMDLIRATLSPYLKPMWQDIASKEGVLRFKPENYIKIGALSNPKIAASFVMIDEAQDTFPVFLGWLKRQPHIRLVVVGDRAQAINEWTGAIDAMDKFESIDRETGLSKNDVTYLTLSKSFRFGPELADEANRWLYLHNEGTFMLEGNESKSTVVTDIDDGGIYDAIICRTNAGVFESAMSLVESGIKVSMSKRNQDELEDIAKAALQLMAGTSCDYEAFQAFDNWHEVKDAVENDPGFSDLKTLVNIIEKYGANALLDLSSRLVPSDMAQTMIITAHTSKGLEFNRVKIWNDFFVPEDTSDGEPGEIPKSEVMLHYVAITRAKEYLYRGSLDMIDLYVNYDDEESDDMEDEDS